MADGTGHEMMDAFDSATLNAAAVGAAGADMVPRSFDYTDLTVLSDGSDNDRDATAGLPTFKAKVAVMHDLPPALPEAESFAEVYSCGSTAQTTKVEPLQTQTSLHTEVQVTVSGASREIIYIDSSGEESEENYESERNDDSERNDESDEDYESERNDENEKSDESYEDDDNDRNDEDASSPIRRLTLEESCCDMPNSRHRAIPISDICAPETTHAAIFVATQNATVETESSEDNVPLAILRRNRLGNKHKMRDNQVTKLTLVNRPTSPPKLSPKRRRQSRIFDSDAFDAAIYIQSELQPPPGVKVPRPTKASSAFPPDARIFVPANPAIHGPVVRSKKWWKDKRREIRDRPKRKTWFGKVTQRMRWLYNKQMAAEAKRQAPVRGAAGRRTRQDPQPAAYKRIIDFGDVPADRLPADVLSTPGWAKACEWQRKMREQDVAMERQVEHICMEFLLGGRPLYLYSTFGRLEMVQTTAA
ncbi:hypothetical protein CCM_01580 [Cordyceps militaris CM01]|uniref:Uncharacterized protein n=1 Tax=Cordyceps militaris (strain CM01) TaxID=983644 RepID=G3J5X0_CORMM|nr:uncharacterized protein CCM_01580 [Cordyceps militaris CM01]EGX96922.1 hypothetical protein CCM_01580 [Cordyceps militaris CM01]